MRFGIGGGVVEGNHREALMAVGERVGRMVVAIVGDAEGGSVDLLKGGGVDLVGEARRGLLVEGGGANLIGEARRGLLAEGRGVDLGVMRACWPCASWSRRSHRGVTPCSQSASWSSPPPHCRKAPSRTAATADCRIFYFFWVEVFIFAFYFSCRSRPHPFQFLGKRFFFLSFLPIRVLFLGRSLKKKIDCVFSLQ
nr:hypothetical protein Iba_chr12aCG7720 [Ipomoea batatas]